MRSIRPRRRPRPAPRPGRLAPIAAGLPAIGLLAAGCTLAPAPPAAPEPVAGGWIDLFDGASLSGWTPKFSGEPLGVNYRDTFRARDGVLAVSYDAYDAFDGKFGHLFSAHPYGHYDLELEYRFVGEQAPGGPGWAFRNNGVMIHGQPPETMRVDQDFPVSIEVQLLGGRAEGERSTGNLCTPGTNVVYDGALDRRHCIGSASATFRGDRWVRLRVEVRGGDVVRHFIDGAEVMHYTQPQLDDRDADAQRLIAARGGETLLTGGTIALQAESHGTEFRRIRLRPIAAHP